MGIGGTGIGGTSQPPQIRESETTAFTEIMKKNILAMLPPDSLEVIPFTQRSYDEAFKYKSEAGKPSLHPLLSLRAGLPETIEEEVWQPVYQSLVDSLPQDVKEQLEQEGLKPFGDRDPGFVAFNSLLILISKGVGWLESVTQPVAPSSQDELNFLQNLALPYVALNAVVDQSQSLLSDAQSYLDNVGPNYPQYDTVANYLGQIKDDVAELNAQKELLQQGQTSPDIQQKMTDLSADFSRLSAQFQQTGSGDFQIIGARLQALSLVSSAWALNYGSSSLLFSLASATTGISGSDSDLGVVGDASNTAVDSLLDGLLSSISTGSGTQLQEMDDLYNALAQLRDQPS